MHVRIMNDQVLAAGLERKTLQRIVIINFSLDRSVELHLF